MMLAMDRTRLARSLFDAIRSRGLTPAIAVGLSDVLYPTTGLLDQNVLLWYDTSGVRCAVLRDDLAPGESDLVSAYSNADAEHRRFYAGEPCDAEAVASRAFLAARMIDMLEFGPVRLECEGIGSAYMLGDGGISEVPYERLNENTFRG